MIITCSSHTNEYHIEFPLSEMIYYLAKEVKQLELEAIHLRYKLSKHISYYDGLLLRSDISLGLANRYEYQETYTKYISLYYEGTDPLDNESYSK